MRRRRRDHGERRARHQQCFQNFPIICPSLFVDGHRVHRSGLQRRPFDAEPLFMRNCNVLRLIPRRCAAPRGPATPARPFSVARICARSATSSVCAPCSLSVPGPRQSPSPGRSAVRRSIRSPRARSRSPARGCCPARCSAMSALASLGARRLDALAGLAREAARRSADQQRDVLARARAAAAARSGRR